MNDIVARRQHDVRRGAAFLADQLERAVIVRLVREYPPHQAAIDDRQVLAIARRQRQHRLACVAAPGGGTVAIDGGTIVGCVNGAGRLGTDPGPEGGARFIAGPEGASGTKAGGTGGGRSENIWAETDAGMKQASTEASTSTGKSRPARPCPPIPSPHEVMGMLFTENAANSSLRAGSGRGRSGTRTKTRC